METIEKCQCCELPASSCKNCITLNVEIYLSNKSTFEIFPFINHVRTEHVSMADILQGDLKIMGIYSGIYLVLPQMKYKRRETYIDSQEKFNIPISKLGVNKNFILRFFVLEFEDEKAIFETGNFPINKRKPICMSIGNLDTEKMTNFAPNGFSILIKEMGKHTQITLIPNK